MPSAVVDDLLPGLSTHVEQTPDGRGPDSHSPTTSSDAEIASRAQGGDRLALEALVQRHQPAVARLLWRFVRTRVDLEDLVQETFLRMVRGIPEWKAAQPFSHWVLRIASNVGRDYFRRQAVRRRWMVDPVECADAADALDSAADPAARAAANEAKELLAHLSPDERALLTLFHLEGWSLGQIAEQYGWTVTATKLRAWRARRHLRTFLKDKDIL